MVFGKVSRKISSISQVSSLLVLALAAMLNATAALAIPSFPTQAQINGTANGAMPAPAGNSTMSLKDLCIWFTKEFPLCTGFLDQANGGSKAPTANPTTVTSAGIATPASLLPITPVAKWTANGPEAQVLTDALKQNSYQARLPIDRQMAIYNFQSALLASQVARYPAFAAQQGQAEQAAQMTSAGNSFGDMTKGQAAAALDYCSKYLINFTNDARSTKWIDLRNMLFVPMGILLLLPGAVLCQVRAIVAAGNPLVGIVAPGQQVHCFDGIFRSIIAIFMIPATFLIVNYGIDVSNSITYTLSSEYTNLFGTNMYQDALCGEIRAFGVRNYAENLASANVAQSDWQSPPVTDQKSLNYAMYNNKLDDPCTKEYSAPADRADELMPGSAVFGRALAFGTNAALTAGWNILCAFQMIYLIYLFLIGPVVAGLWAWPTGQLQRALPQWVEGVITICFWSLFWNTVVLLMACFHGVSGDTGTIMTSALNFLATAAVKYAFDFSQLIRDAGMQAAQQAQNSGGGGKDQPGQKGGHKPPQKGPQHPNRTNTPNGRPGQPARTPGHPHLAQTPGTHTDPLHPNTTGRPGEITTPTGNRGTATTALGSPIVGGAGLGAVPPPNAHGLAGDIPSPTNRSFVGSTDIHIPGPNGGDFKLTLGQPDSKGHQALTLSTPDGKVLGTQEIPAGSLGNHSQTLAFGNYSLDVARSGATTTFGLTTPSGEQGTASLHNYLAPGFSPPGTDPNVKLPPGATALQDLPGTGTLARMADGSLGIVEPSGKIDALKNGVAILADGTRVGVEVGNVGNSPTGQGFMEVSQIRPDGATDVSVIPTHSGSNGDTLGPNNVLLASAPMGIAGQIINGQNTPGQGITNPYSESEMKGLSTMAQARDANGSPDVSYRYEGATLQALDKSGEVVAQFDAGRGWEAVSRDGTTGALTNTGVFMADNGTFYAGSQAVTFDHAGTMFAAGTEYQYNPSTQSFSVNGYNIPANELGNSNVLQQMSTNDQALAGLHTVAAERDTNNPQGQFHLESNGSVIDAVGNNGQVIAQYDQGKGWEMVSGGAATGVMMSSSDGQFYAGSQPVSTDATGAIYASGTSFAYNTDSNTFSVYGTNVPANILGDGTLLQQAQNGVYSAEATVAALKIPGVAENILAAVSGDQTARTAVESALSGYGVNTDTLYQAATGNLTAGIAVMGQEIQANHRLGEQVAHNLGITEAQLRNAESNPQPILNAEAARNSWLEQHMTTNSGGESYVSLSAPSYSASDAVFNTAMGGDILSSTAWNGGDIVNTSGTTLNTAWTDGSIVNNTALNGGTTLNAALNSGDILNNGGTTLNTAWNGGDIVVSNPGTPIPASWGGSPITPTYASYDAPDTTYKSYNTVAGEQPVVRNDVLASEVTGVLSQLVAPNEVVPTLLPTEPRQVFAETPSESNYANYYNSASLTPAPTPYPATGPDQVTYSGGLVPGMAPIMQPSSPTTFGQDNTLVSREISTASLTPANPSSGDQVFDTYVNDPTTLTTAASGILQGVTPALTQDSGLQPNGQPLPQNGQAMNDEKRQPNSDILLTSGPAGRKLNQIVASMNGTVPIAPPPIATPQIVVPVPNRETDLTQAQAQPAAKIATEDWAKWKAPVRKGKNGVLTEQEMAELKQQLDGMTQA